MSARLCKCGHAEHAYFCLVSGCKCEHFEQAQCECTGEACGGYGKRHNGLSRCFNNASEKVTVAVKVEGANTPYQTTVDQTRLYCYPCARRHERIGEDARADYCDITPYHGGSDDDE